MNRQFSVGGFVLLAVMLRLSAAAAEEPAAVAKRPSPADVRQYGARGDGKADDTEAIQRAVDSKLGDVRLPRGQYRISRPIVVDLDKVGFTSVVGSGTARLACPRATSERYPGRLPSLLTLE